MEPNFFFNSIFPLPDKFWRHKNELESPVIVVETTRSQHLLLTFTKLRWSYR